MKSTNKILFLSNSKFFHNNLMNYSNKNFNSKIIKIINLPVNFSKFSKNIEKEIINYSPNTIVNLLGIYGGIEFNKKNQLFLIHQNLKISISLIECLKKTKNLNFIINLGASCLYQNSISTLKEKNIHKINFETSNREYSTFRYASMVAIQAFANESKLKSSTIIPATLYGPHDKNNEKDCHVLQAMFLKMQESKKNNIEHIRFFGSPKTKREFLYIDDLFSAIFFIINNYKKVPEVINISSGYEITMQNLAKKIAKNIDYKGKIVFDNDSKFSSVNRKILSGKILKRMNWLAKVDIETGLKLMFKKNI